MDVILKLQRVKELIYKYRNDFITSEQRQELFEYLGIQENSLHSEEGIQFLKGVCCGIIIAAKIVETEKGS